MARALEPNADDELTFTEVVTDADIENVDHTLPTTVELHAVDGTEQTGDARTPSWLSATVTEVGDTGDAWREEVHVTIQKDGLSTETTYTFKLEATDGIDTTTRLVDLEVARVHPLGFVDGTKFYLLEEGSNNLYEYDAGTARDPTTGSHVQTFTAGDLTGDGNFSVRFGPAGERMYLNEGPTLYQYSLSTPWDISSASFVRTATPSEEIHHIDFHPDGDRMWGIYSTDSVIRLYTLGTPWDISTLGSPDSAFDLSNTNSIPRGFTFSLDGEYFYFIGSSGDDSIYQFSLDSPYDLSTRTLMETLNLADNGLDDVGNFSDLRISSDGVWIYWPDINNSIEVLHLSTAFDLSTWSHHGTFTPPEIGNFISGIAWGVA